MKINQFIHNLELLPQRIQEHCKQAMTEVLQQMVAHAKAHHPYEDRSGNLTNSIQSSIIESSDASVKASFSAQAEYAEAVEYGTHQGSQPLPFMRPTVEMFKPQLEEALQKAVQLALEEVMK